ncbi:MAG: hypothetical protein FJ253_06650 [Phycisphaerae bacterium]|nr:hypothetical protein [Phycisphaerae bacterium]
MSAIALALTAAALGPVYVGAGGLVPDATISNNIPNSGLFTSSVISTDVGTISDIKMVTLTGLFHSWVGDLQVALISPNGTRVNLFSRVGVTSASGFGSSKDINGTYGFTDGIGSPPWEPFGGGGFYPSGTYNRVTNTNAPVVQIGTVSGVQGVNNNTYASLNGGPSNGTWTLEIRDFYLTAQGLLGSWTLDFNFIPAPGAIALLGLAGMTARRRRA